MRISDWSSDVCSSDLQDSGLPETGEATEELFDRLRISLWAEDPASAVIGAQSGEPASSARRSIGASAAPWGAGPNVSEQGRKSVAQGKRWSVRGSPGGCRSIKKNKKTKHHTIN